MNIFLPQKSLIESANCLDNVRLQKQILECVEMYAVYTENKDNLFDSNIQINKHGKETSKWINLKKSVFHHPVYLHYAEHCPNIFINFTICCLAVYQKRMGKKHYYHSYIYKEFIYSEMSWLEMPIIPFYSELPSNDPNCIRTTENVEKLFQDKLFKKWEQDKAKGRPPKWTNRDIPDFYIEFLKEKRYV